MPNSIGDLNRNDSFRIRLFGYPQLTAHKPLTLRKKSIALVSFLIVEKREVPRSIISTLLWPFSNQATARTNLRTCLYEINHLFPESFLIKNGELLSIDPKGIWIDLEQLNKFDLIIKEGIPLSELPFILEDCFDIYRGEFLEGFSLPDCSDFELWQQNNTNRYMQIFSQIIEQLINLCIDYKAYQIAIKPALMLIQIDPVEETFHRLLMTIYGHCRMWSAVEQQFEECCRILEDELDADAEQDTWDLLYRIRNRTDEFTPVSENPANLQGIPRNLLEKKLIGRKDELIRIEKLLFSTSRILTITGSGGIGKTSIAVTLAKECSGRFPDGVVFVDLSKIEDHRNIVHSISSSAGIIDSNIVDSDRIKRITKQLSERKMLIILDNFEHIIEGAPEVAYLVSNTEQVRFLITSREKLNISLESVVSVNELSLNDAITLFLERSSVKFPGRLYSPEDEIIIGKICRFLDKIPLAIELAVPHLSLFSLKELLNQLENPLILLTNGDRDYPERHQSLEKTLGWSYQLLSDSEQLLFSELSVFVNGFDLSAAEFVSSFNRKDMFYNNFQSLVEKNFINKLKSGKTARFYMHQTTKSYGEKCRHKFDRPMDIQNTHAEYYYKLAEDSEQEINKIDQYIYLNQLEIEDANLNRALQTFFERDQIEKGLEMSINLSGFFYRTGRFLSGSDWLTKFLTVYSEKPSSLRARGLFNQGLLAFYLGNLTSACLILEESCRISRISHNVRCECLALDYLSIAERWLGNAEKGWDISGKAISMARSTGDPFIISRALITSFSTSGGQFVNYCPVDDLKEAISLCLDIGDTWGFANSLCGLGDYYLVQGELGKAMENYNEALNKFKALDDRFMISWTLDGMSRSEEKKGDTQKAYLYGIESLFKFDDLGDSLNVGLIISRLIKLPGMFNDQYITELAGCAYTLVTGYKKKQGVQSSEIDVNIKTLERMEEKDPAKWIQGRSMTQAKAVSLLKDHLKSIGAEVL